MSGVKHDETSYAILTMCALPRGVSQSSHSQVHRHITLYPILPIMETMIDTRYKMVVNSQETHLLANNIWVSCKPDVWRYGSPFVNMKLAYVCHVHLGFKDAISGLSWHLYIYICIPYSCWIYIIYISQTHLYTHIPMALHDGYSAMQKGISTCFWVARNNQSCGYIIHLLTEISLNRYRNSIDVPCSHILPDVLIIFPTSSVKEKPQISIGECCQATGYCKGCQAALGWSRTPGWDGVDQPLDMEK